MAYMVSVTGMWELVALLMDISEELNPKGTEEEGQEGMEIELDNVLMKKLSEVLGRPRANLALEELKGMNQQDISMSLDTKNSYLLITSITLCGACALNTIRKMG